MAVVSLRRIRETALRVYPRKLWFAVGGDVHDGAHRIARCTTPADADLIAACNPVAVLALIRLIDAYESLAVEVAACHKSSCSCGVCARLDAVAAAKEAM